MYRYLERRLVEHLREFLHRTYGLETVNIVVEQPPKIEFGEYALPLAFELARKLRKAPRKIAEEIVAGVGSIPGFEKFEVAGGGYINVRVNRAELAAALVADEMPTGNHTVWQSAGGALQYQSEQSRAHRTPAQRHSRRHVCSAAAFRGQGSGCSELHRQHRSASCRRGCWLSAHRKKSRAEIEALAAAPRFDYVCWDLYARVSQWYEQDKANLKVRGGRYCMRSRQGNNETAEIAEMISTGHAAPTPRDHEAPGNGVRFSSPRGRNSAFAFLGCGVSSA